MTLEHGEYRLDFMIGKTIKDIVHYENRDSLLIEFTDGSQFEIEDMFHMWFDAKRIVGGKLE